MSEALPVIDCAGLAALPTCGGERYPPIRAMDHLTERLDRTYAHRRA